MREKEKTRIGRTERGRKEERRRERKSTFRNILSSLNIIIKRYME